MTFVTKHGRSDEFPKEEHKHTLNNVPKQSVDSRLRNYLSRTNLDLIVIGILIAYHNTSHVLAAEEDASGESGAEIEEEETEDVYAVLYPWFVQIIGVFAYYALSRYAHALPFTGVMFIIGFFIGFSVQRTKLNAVTLSAEKWLGIEGEVILLVFLPGLLYLDSYNIDVHLFLQTFWQLITFAFPMVLGGTVLTALVAFHIFPYGWSFNLCMTFGSILSATDPVAVAVLLNELGAPPRLKMHIAGESLLNDGSAVVFYQIFSNLFLFELGIPGVGDDIGWGEGFVKFFRLSLGGMCIGIAFGVCTVIMLYHLNRRLSGEDSVVQIVLTITAAYLAFFTAEILSKCSGIIATMFLGITVKAFGETMINNVELMHHFWEIAEFLLNTLLFTLGGTVWGDIISNDRYTEFGATFESIDWAYLLLLYVALTIIRYFLLLAFYPITLKLGLGTNWKEAVFMGWAGLRGTVGIALSLSLNSEIDLYTSAVEIDSETRQQYREYTGKLFAFVGGNALLTLIVNGITSGPLLKKLGLVTPTETRLKIVESYRLHIKNRALDDYVEMLADERFRDLDYTVIKAHVSFLNNITYDQLMSAVKKHKVGEISHLKALHISHLTFIKANTPAHEYRTPNRKNVVPYLYEEPGAINRTYPLPRVTPSGDVMKIKRQRETSVRAMQRTRLQKSTMFNDAKAADENQIREERMIFLRILRSRYFKLIEQGEIESRGFIAHAFFQSLDFEEDRVLRGLSLNDWEALQVASSTLSRPAEYLRTRVFRLTRGVKGTKELSMGMEAFLVHLQVWQVLAFVQAHKDAAAMFKEEFADATLTSAQTIVLEESAAQIKLADKTLQGLDKDDVNMMKSHYACQVLLGQSARQVRWLTDHGFMTGREAGDFFGEIEAEMHQLANCREFVHLDEMTQHAKVKSFSNLPPFMLADMNLEDEVQIYKRSLEKGEDVSGFFSSQTSDAVE